MNWADGKNCKCCQAEGTENIDFTTARNGRRKRNNMPDAVRSCEMKATQSKQNWTWQRWLTSFPHSGNESARLGKKIECLTLLGMGQNNRRIP